MHGHVETHTVGWLKRVKYNSSQSIDSKTKSRLICEILAGFPIPLIIAEETKNQLEAVTCIHYVNAINEFINGQFNLENNPIMDKFLDSTYFNLSFKDLATQSKDFLIIDQQVAVFIVRDLTLEEREFLFKKDKIKPGAIEKVDKKAVNSETSQINNSHTFNEKVEEVLEKILKHPFFSKVNIPNLGTDVIAQCFMVTPNGVDRDLSVKNITSFKENLPIEQLEEMESSLKVFDFLNHAFKDEKTAYLRKAHLPMIYLSAVKAISIKMNPQSFFQKIEQFFASENLQYKQAGQSGTAGKSNVNIRIRVMLDYFEK